MSRPMDRRIGDNAASSIPDRHRLIIAAVVLSASILFGGGGTPAPLSELVVQLVAILGLALWAILPNRGPDQSVDRWIMLIVAGPAILAGLQLIPLPPAIWQSLPQRSVEAEALALVGGASQWMPLSVTPVRTLSGLLSIIPPMILAYMTIKLSERSRTWLLLVFACLGALAAMVGTIQIASGNGNLLRFYASTHYGYATGFQASRNLQADVLLMAAMATMVPIAAMALRRNDRNRQLLAIVPALVLLLSVVLTGSRAGFVFIPLAALGSALILIRPSQLRNRKVIGAGIGVIVLTGIAFLALQNNNQIARTLARFEEQDAVRPQIWEDSRFAAEQYWPLGAGVGSFQTVFPTAERLEYLRPTYANRAHNDYLEIAIETGAVGLAGLLLAAILLLARMIGIARSSPSRERYGHMIFTVFVLAIIGLHSLFDYPLRTMSIACIAAVAVALLSKAQTVRASRRSALTDAVADADRAARTSRIE
ncbi:O-antigen ligase family protein [Sphingomonas sp. CJ99]